MTFTRAGEGLMIPVLIKSILKQYLICSSKKLVWFHLPEEVLAPHSDAQLEAQLCLTLLLDSFPLRELESFGLELL